MTRAKAVLQIVFTAIAVIVYLLAYYMAFNFSDMFTSFNAPIPTLTKYLVYHRGIYLFFIGLSVLSLFGLWGSKLGQGWQKALFRVSVFNLIGSGILFALLTVAIYLPVISSNSA